MHAAAPRDGTHSLASNVARPPGGSWSRACRLVHRSQFDAVYRQGQRRASPLFVVFFRPNGLGINRFGMSVRKALGGAVVRNRVRRRFREILRQHGQEIGSGWDIVIQPRMPALQAPPPQLLAEVRRLLGVIISAPRRKLG